MGALLSLLHYSPHRGFPDYLFQSFLEEYFPESDSPGVGSLMAVLAVIGGIDGRLRLGGQVVHEEYGEGTVTRITPKGRITVQFYEMRTCRVCLLSHLRPVRTFTSSLRLRFSEMFLLMILVFVSSARSSDLQCSQPALH